MTKKQLTILIVALVFACLCLACAVIGGLAYFGKNFSDSIENSNDPAKVQEMSEKIASFETPEGYQAMAMNVLVYDYIVLTPQKSSARAKPMIMLMQFKTNSGMSEEQMVEQMQRTFAQQSGQGSGQMRVVEEKTITIRGEEVKATVLESDESGTYQMRQMITVFKGNNGLVVLMIQGIVDEWDDQLVDDFIASIK